MDADMIYSLKFKKEKDYLLTLFIAQYKHNGLITSMGGLC